MSLALMDEEARAAGVRPQASETRQESNYAPVQRPAVDPALPMQGQPMQGQPMQGQPMQGQPIQGQAVQGQAVQGQPIQGQPIQGQPMQGLPMQGLPMQGLPMQGPAMQGLPMQGAPMQAMAGPWPPAPYYSQEGSMAGPAQHKRSVESKSKGKKSSKGPKGHRKGSGTRHGGDAPAGPPQDREAMERLIDRNREALEAANRKKQANAAAQQRFKQGQMGYGLFRSNFYTLPSYSAMLLVCIWISLVSGISILAFGALFRVFVQATPFFYVALGTGSSLLALAGLLAAFRSNTPVSALFAA